MCVCVCVCLFVLASFGLHVFVYLTNDYLYSFLTSLQFFTVLDKLFVLSCIH